MICRAIAALIAASLSFPAAAEVTDEAISGFTSRNEVEVAADSHEVWRVMIQPGLWWNSDHTYSGDARNMTLVASPGGCFCEAIPTGSATAAGSIEHMRVIYAAPGATLRLSGGLGPLQSQAVTGILTMSLEPSGEGTRIAWEYTVGGYLRLPVDTTAPLVDGVVGEQLDRLAAALAAGN
jgi:hypothetical protein